MNKKISFLGIFLMLLAAFVSAELAFDPVSVDFGDANQDSSVETTLTITNPGPENATEITLDSGLFSYSNEFIGNKSFEGSTIFSPNNFTLIPDESEDVNVTMTVPSLSTMMGQYTATFTALYNDTINQDITTAVITATVFVDQYTGQAGYLEIVDTDSYDDIPDQMRAGRTIELNIDVENTGNEDLTTNVMLEVWLYNSDLKQVVAFEESSSDQTIDDGQDETFTIDLDLHENLDPNDNYDLYVKAYKTDDEATHHDVKVKEDVNILGEDDLCDVGDLRIEDFDLDDDEYSPGDTIIVDVEVENRGNDDIDDVIVEVWITEEGKTRKIESEESDRIDIDEDKKESFQFELDLDDDLDDGDYEVHVIAYEDDNEDEQCIEEVEVVDIDRPDHKVIIDEIIITPITLSCEGTFTAELDVKNVGRRNDDAVKVRMYNSALGIDIYSETFELDKYDDSDDDNTVYLTADIPADMENQDYTLTFTLYYDDLDEQKNYVESITLSGCVATEVLEEEVIVDTTQENQEEQNMVFLPTGWAGLGLEEGTWTTVFWILGDIVLVIVAIYFLVLLFRKRR